MTIRRIGYFEVYLRSSTEGHPTRRHSVVVQSWWPLISLGGSVDHGGLAIEAKISHFADKDLAYEAFSAQTEKLQDQIVVEIDDPVFERIERKYPLKCEKHAVVPLRDIPKNLRVIYKLRYYP